MDKKMVARMLHILIILQFISLFIATSCDRKSRNRKDSRQAMMPHYQIHPTSTLPSDVQVNTFLGKGETKSFFYMSQIDYGSLSATVITCSSPVRWIMQFSTTNNTGTLLDGFVTRGIQTYHFPMVLKGQYTLQMVALERNTFVHIYISTEQGGPQALQNAQNQELRLLKRQRRKRLTIKWNSSMVDPQGTDYCLVISTQRHYSSLCSAQAEKYGTPPIIANNGRPITKSQTVTAFHDIDNKSEPFIACVGRKTQHTISNLQQGQSYYFDLFATNHQSNFTYPYGSNSTTFDGHIKPAKLKDGKATFANLKKLDGKAVFRYKVGRRTAKSFDLFVVPCGGAVEVEITNKDKTIQTPTRIEGFGKISIPNPQGMTRYYIKIYALNREELKKTSGVEVILYATTRSPSRIPLPNMPQEVRVQEYTSMKTCNSVTVGWLAAPVQKTVHYCLVVKEGKIRETEDYRMPNQCGLENRLRKSADVIIKYCRDDKYDKEQVIMQEISPLKPGRFYIVQVTVKKPKGKTLSYNLLQVNTKASCNRQ